LKIKLNRKGRYSSWVPEGDREGKGWRGKVGEKDCFFSHQGGSISWEEKRP